ncbi:hypothetical protein G7Y89_g2733 [Cudoniella acicularis]|uniref:Uncharacterized protein n=1 Tax=Cudoniella acicularis TaxID=354080 RepID=A0A8H4RTK6_9HELO|nr:hypothetical protein G7Y89_g2733 [Cudoniella acicularis]
MGVVKPDPNQDKEPSPPLDEGQKGRTEHKRREDALESELEDELEWDDWPESNHKGTGRDSSVKKHERKESELEGELKGELEDKSESDWVRDWAESSHEGTGRDNSVKHEREESKLEGELKDKSEYEWLEF